MQRHLRMLSYSFRTVLEGNYAAGIVNLHLHLRMLIMLCSAFKVTTTMSSFVRPRFLSTPIDQVETWKEKKGSVKQAASLYPTFCIKIILNQIAGWSFIKWVVKKSRFLGKNIFILCHYILYKSLEWFILGFLGEGREKHVNWGTQTLVTSCLLLFEAILLYSFIPRRENPEHMRPQTSQAFDHCNILNN